MLLPLPVVLHVKAHAASCCCGGGCDQAAVKALPQALQGSVLACTGRETCVSVKLVSLSARGNMKLAAVRLGWLLPCLQVASRAGDEQCFSLLLELALDRFAEVAFLCCSWLW